MPTIITTHMANVRETSVLMHGMSIVIPILCHCLHMPQIRCHLTVEMNQIQPREQCDQNDARSNKNTVPDGKGREHAPPVTRRSYEPRQENGAYCPLFFQWSRPRSDPARLLGFQRTGKSEAVCSRVASVVEVEGFCSVWIEPGYAFRSHI